MPTPKARGRISPTHKQDCTDFTASHRGPSIGMPRCLRRGSMNRRSKMSNQDGNKTQSQSGNKHTQSGSQQNQQHDRSTPQGGRGGQQGSQDDQTNKQQRQQ